MAIWGLVEDGILLQEVHKGMSEPYKVRDEGVLISKDTKDFMNFFNIT